MSAGGIRALLWSTLISLLCILLITVCFAQGVPCRYVPNGSNITIACANGYWQTTTPDGEVVTGNGTPDPSASAAGSSIVINPGNPTQIFEGWDVGVISTSGAFTNVSSQCDEVGRDGATGGPMLAPHQAESFGFQPRLD